jgi:hypothetical protein
MRRGQPFSVWINTRAPPSAGARFFRLHKPQTQPSAAEEENRSDMGCFAHHDDMQIAEAAAAVKE